MMRDIKNRIVKQVVASAIICQLFLHKRLIDFVQIILFVDKKTNDLLCAIHYLRTLYFRKTRLYNSYIEFIQECLDFLDKHRLILPSLNTNTFVLPLKYALCFALTVTLFVYPSTIRAEEGISEIEVGDVNDGSEDLNNGHDGDNQVEQEPTEDEKIETEVEEDLNDVLKNEKDMFNISAYLNEDPYLTSSNGAMRYSIKDGETEHIQGFHGEEWKLTTYNNNGFNYAIVVEDEFYKSEGLARGETETLNGQFEITSNYSFANAGNYVKTSFAVKNISATAAKIKFAIYGDVQIGKNDNAHIVKTSQGIKMIESVEGAQFNIIYKDAGLITNPADQCWIGDYSNRSIEKWFTDNDEQNKNGMDTVIGINWLEQSIEADSSVTYTILVGIGNASETIPKLEFAEEYENLVSYGDLKFAINASDEETIPNKLLGKYDDGEEFEIETFKDLSGNQIEKSINMNLPKNLEIGEHKLTLWLSNDAGLMSTPIVLKFNYEQKDYLIIYNDNLASKGTISQSFNIEEQNSEEPPLKYFDKNAFEKFGYEIESWNLLSDGKGTKYTVDSPILGYEKKDLITSINLYAQWKKLDSILNVEALIEALIEPEYLNSSNVSTNKDAIIAAKTAFDALKSVESDFRSIVGKEYRDKLDELLLKLIEIKEGTANSKVITETGAPSTSVKGLESQIEKPSAGSKTVELTVKKEQEPSDKYIVDAQLKDNTVVGTFLDIKLEETITNESDTSISSITELPYPITLTFVIPLELQGNLNHYMIRVHNNKAMILPDIDTDPNTITIETDKFSTYALCYEEKAIVDPEPPVNNSSSGGSSNVTKEDKLETGSITGSLYAIPARSELVIDQKRAGEVYREYRSNVKAWSTLFDLKLIQKENIVELKGEVSVTLPIPNNYNPEQLKLIEILADGSISEKQFTVKENLILFKTNHLGNFVLSDLSNHKGWEPDTSDWYYYNETGGLHTGFVAANQGRWYYCENGLMLVNQWKQDANKKWYYFNENGVMERNKEINFNGEMHSVNEHGSMIL